MLYFFLSYAKGDDEDFVDQFYRDLSTEVRLLAGEDSGTEVGFLDTHSIQFGADWSENLVNALSECCSFVALLSPRYFLSVACGREWTIFADRVRRQPNPAPSPGIPSAMLPVAWLPTTMHEVAAALQHTTDEFGEAYRRYGFRQLLRLQRNRDDYLEAVSTLASHIVRVANEHAPARHRPAAAFEEIPSAFHATATASVVAAAPGEINGRPGLGAQFVHFVVATASREVAATVRQNTDFYGADCLEWAPYRPALPGPLADFARTIAAERSFASGVVCAEELDERLDWARQRNQIVVLLVDVWIAQLDEHRDRLVDCDQRASRGETPPLAILVPFSANDSETQTQRKRLTDLVRSIFASRVAAGDETTLRTSVLNHQSFQFDLSDVLEIARNLMFVKGSVIRLPPGESTEQPRLQGP